MSVHLLLCVGIALLFCSLHTRNVFRDGATRRATQRVRFVARSVRACTYNSEIPVARVTGFADFHAVLQTWPFVCTVIVVREEKCV